MPELPEVQTIVNELNLKIKGNVINNVWTSKENLIRNISFDKFKKEIKGKKILNIQRRAKYIIFELSDNYILLVHLKMTGHFLLGKWNIEGGKANPIIEGPIKTDSYNQHVHIIFYLDQEKELGFSDVRQFGKIELYTKEEFKNVKEINKLGVEPLTKEFTFDCFKSIIKNTKTNIKKLLMDQEKIAGIGNVYASEILFLAKINPLRNTKTLNELELKNIYDAIKIILNKALKFQGNSISDYRKVDGKKGDYQNHALVYGKRGENCPNCEGKIKYVKINQRGTFYCPLCQK